MIRIADIGEELAAGGLLIGLLTPAGDGVVEFDTTWFGHALSTLEASGTRLPDLVALIAATLGPATAGAPPVFTDAQWYAVPDPYFGQSTALQIVASASAASSGQIGLGVFYPISFGEISGCSYAYVPLFAYDSNGAQLIIDSEADPCQIGVRLTSPTPFEIEDENAQTVSFTAVTLAGNFFLAQSAYDTSSSPALLEIVFENLSGTTKPNTYTTLASLLDPDVEAWLLQVLIQSGAWLNLYIAGTFTVGDLLEAAGLLIRDYQLQSGNFTNVEMLAALLSSPSSDPISAYLWSQMPLVDQTVLQNPTLPETAVTSALLDGLNGIINSGTSIYDPTRFADILLLPETSMLLGQNPQGAPLARLNRLLLDDAYSALIEPNPYSLNLAELDGCPADIALDLLFGAFDTLSLAEVPLISLPGGGLFVVSQQNPKDNSCDYGLRLVFEVPLGGTSPAVDLCIGTWLSGESHADNWMTRSGGNAPGYQPGAAVLLLNRDADDNLTFAPAFELVSVGFSFRGPSNAPLLSLNGYTLGGTDLRLFLSPGDPIAPASGWQYGFGVGLADFGFPLSPSAATGASGNPVAQNLLSSGSGSSGTGADQEPVNPAFSAAVAWRSDSTSSPQLGLQLFGSDGSPTDAAWIPMQRSFGPISCKRIGIACDASVPSLTLLLDGGVALGPLEIDLVDLSIGVPLSTPADLDNYKLELDGLAVSYVSGPLTIQGGLDKVISGKLTDYEGSLLIQAGTWSIDAIGSYAVFDDGDPSIFVFARLGASIGGPPFCFVTGMCAGFGYNRSLSLPGQDQVPVFPLLAGIADPSAIGGADASLGHVLDSLDNYISVARGEKWVAAGLQFTSFELVQSNAVLAVSDGVGFEVAVLGISRCKLPQCGIEPFGYMELGIEIVLEPSLGFFGASADISSNSYVIDAACHLTGGFAFYVWFAEPQDGGADHTGDFVVTLGGYNPAFRQPAWYPDEARLGFSWQVCNQITLSGNAYFALTPSCVMGGGLVDLEFHAGDLHAWFVAQADFLFHWKPFYFQGSVGVSVGVSYKLDAGFCSITVKAELGGSLALSGPPTAGCVTLHWYVISFSISFGQDATAPSAAIDWPDFSQLLPQNDSATSQDPPEDARSSGLRTGAAADSPLPTNICKFVINGGLSSAVPDSDSQGGLRWIVRADSIRFSAQTAFPLTMAQVDDGVPVYPQAEDPVPSVAVRPMGISSSSLQSVMQVSCAVASGGSETLAAWAATPVLGTTPAALWGAPMPGTPTPSADTVPGSFLGLSGFTPPPPTLCGPPEIPLANLALYSLDEYGSDFLPLSSQQAGVMPNAVATNGSLLLIAVSVADPAVVATRDALFAALLDFGYEAGANGDTTEIGAQVNLNYADAPMLGSPWQI